MKYLSQFLIILVFSLLGELLQVLIPLPISASIYGFILMFIALCTGLLKPEKVSVAADWLISIMPLLFVAPAANILVHFHVIAPALASILAVIVISTLVIFAVSGTVTRLLMKKEDGEDA